MALTERLASLGISLPNVPGPFGAYVPARVAGGLCFTAGQLPIKEGKLLATGQVSSVCSEDQARLGARQCVIAALAAAKTAVGELDKLAGVVRLGVYVSSDTEFTDQSKVANGASELLIEIFGDAGKHARVAIGVASLPMNASVEVEVVFDLK